MQLNAIAYNVKTNEISIRYVDDAGKKKSLTTDEDCVENVSPFEAMQQFMAILGPRCDIAPSVTLMIVKITVSKKKISVKAAAQSSSNSDTVPYVIQATFSIESCADKFKNLLATVINYLPKAS
jgi:hypothetical protein